MIGLLCHPQGAGQSIAVVKDLTLDEVTQWADLIGDAGAKLKGAMQDG